MKGRQPQHAKQPWGGHAGLQPPWRVYEAAFHPSQHPTTPSGTELEAGRPCWPVLRLCPQLGPISPHPTTSRADTPQRATTPTHRKWAYLEWNRLLEVSSESLGLRRGMGWAGVCGTASISPPEAISGRGAPWRDTTPQPAAPRDLMGVWDRCDAQKRKDCASGDVLRVGGSSRALPSRHTETTEKEAVEGDVFGPSACRWVVRSPKRHVPDDFDVWERRGWGEWRSSDHALSSNR